MEGVAQILPKSSAPRVARKAVPPHRLQLLQAACTLASPMPAREPCPSLLCVCSATDLGPPEAGVWLSPVLTFLSVAGRLRAQHPVCSLG